MWFEASGDKKVIQVEMPKQRFGKTLFARHLHFNAPPGAGPSKWDLDF